MGLLTRVLLYAFVSYNCSVLVASVAINVGDGSHKWPTVGISILVRNKAHTLPYFLSCLRRLDYPKDRLYILYEFPRSVIIPIDLYLPWTKEDLVKALEHRDASGTLTSRGCLFDQSAVVGYELLTSRSTHVLLDTICFFIESVAFVVQRMKCCISTCKSYSEKHRNATDSISLPRIYSDYNEDNSVEILDKWCEKHGNDYNGVYLHTNASSGRLHADERSAVHWSPGHFQHVIRLREQALNFARKMWADFIFMLDADAYLTDPSTLKHLVIKDFTIVAPMLVSDGLYSNFWCGMSENYYYERTDDYKPILNKDKTGCFDVPMVHTAVLISLKRRESDSLTYDPRIVNNYDGPEDDIITFAINSKNNGIKLNVCNDHDYGFLQVPLEDNDPLSNDLDQLLNIKLEAISRGTPLPLQQDMAEYVTYPKPWKYGVDEIYMINLERRSERRRLMELSFRELGMDATLFTAVDGRNIDMNDLREHSITLMPNYEDPYHRRPMKAGEVGCFLSHYFIWQKVLESGHEMALVLEDDIHFVPYFRSRFLQLLDEIRPLEWDIVYIGRKILSESSEDYVTAHTTRPSYSYWTLGYLVSRRGAERLLRAEPLARLLPVDEFLPIMFDHHPNCTWKAYFPRRDVVALSAAPLLVHPTHYTGQPGYTSDTEDSRLLPSPASPPPSSRHEL